MSPEDKELLQKTYDLAKENNKMLLKINRTRKLSIAWKAFYWTAIIAFSFGAYYFIQPYIDFMKETLPSGFNIGSTISDFQSLTQ